MKPGPWWQSALITRVLFLVGDTSVGCHVPISYRQHVTDYPIHALQ